MKKLYHTLSCALIILSLFPGNLHAQTSYEVNVANVGSGGFSPAELSIVVGDTVRWTNTEGFHSVDANADQFPGNPEAFGNDPGSAGWVYEHVFTIAGTYNYWCGVHTQNMTGSITVSEATGVDDVEGTEIISLYPNPAVHELKWNINDGASIQHGTLTLFDINGKSVAQIIMEAQTSIDISGYETGMYFYQISEGTTLLQTGKLLVISQ